MFILKRHLIILLFFSNLIFFGCFQNEIKSIVSDIDGEEYNKELLGEMSIRKATLLILEHRKEEVPIAFQLIISDSLICANKEWRNKHFKAFSIVISKFNEADKLKAEKDLFNYFLHYPKEYLHEIETLPLETSDMFLCMISNQIKEYLQSEKITIYSVINVTIKNCTECNDKITSTIIEYINLAGRYLQE